MRNYGRKRLLFILDSVPPEEWEGAVTCIWPSNTRFPSFSPLVIENDCRHDMCTVFLVAVVQYTKPYAGKRGESVIFSFSSSPSVSA